MRICLFSDTIGDLNGVSRFIQDMAENALVNGDELHVITSTAKYCPVASNIHNFAPSFRINMPYYKELDIAFAPSKAITSFVESLQPDIIHVSTPGPVGLLGRKYAKKKGITLLGTYHTDFPAYIRDNTGSDFFKRLTDRWMKNFYKEFVHVFSRSDQYHQIMQDDIGIAAEKISYIPAGTNLERFSPKHKDDAIWSNLNISSDSVKVLYVGRITKEKSLPFLLEVWQNLKSRYFQLNAELILVGEGNLKKQAQALQSFGVHYLGPIIGSELSSIYASSDIFIFPSLTDTLGQVVMESAASGLPVLVSSIGGPKTLLNVSDPNGYVIKENHLRVWVDTLAKVIQEENLRLKLGKSSHLHMQSFDIRDSYQAFWEVHKGYYKEPRELHLCHKNIT
ncbi:MAG: glycosyltransferase family 1 protein [Campylobacterota bacterium]|nr:glycosyltransferase family 1 protein [Campylobacterota bacterium]